MSTEQRWIAGAVLLVALLAWLGTPTRRADDELRLAPDALGPAGGAGLLAAARALDVPASMYSSDWSLFVREHRAEAMLSLQPAIPPTPEELTEFLRWIELGGRALFVPAGPSSLGGEDFGGADADSLLKRLGLELVSTSSTAKRVDTLDRSLLARELLDGLDADFGSVSAGFALRGDTSIRDGPTPDLEPLVVADSDRFIAARVERGAGELFLVSDAQALASAQLGTGELPKLVARIMLHLSSADSAEPRTLYFDRYHHVGGWRRGGSGVLGRLALTTRLGRALLALSAVLLIALLVRGVRLGPPLGEATPAGRSSLEHAEALAHGYARVHAGRRPARALLRGAARRLSHTGAANSKGGGGVRLGTETLEPALERALQHAPDLAPDVTRIRKAVSRADSEAPLDPDELVRLASSLDAVVTVLES